jgi:nicotinamide mononucleotide adenylyltransferase
MKAYSQFLRELPSKQVVIAFGDFQPPTTSHELLIKTVSNLATEQKSAQFIYTSLTEDSKKNPLPADRKIYFLKRMFSEANFRTAEDLLQAAKELNEKYNSIVLVTGSDLVQEYQKLLEKNNGKLFNFTKIAVVSSGTLDADAESNVSKIREAVKKGDQSTFKESLPNTLTTLDSKRLMNEMRQGMGLEVLKEELKLATDWLRESYYRGEIFKIGELVESNGQRFEIMDRGSNYVVVVDGNGNTSRKWIKDVSSIKEDITTNTDTDPEEITYKGYKTKNFNSDNNVVSCFLRLIKQPDIDPVALLTAIKSTDEYLGIHHKAQEVDNITPEQEKAFGVSFHRAQEYLIKLGDLQHHIDYMNTKVHEVQQVKAQYHTGTFDDAFGESLLSFKELMEMKFTATDKIKVARIIANALGVIDVEKTSSAEQLVNNALRKVRNKPMRPEYADVIQHMLLTAREAGIEYDEKLVPKKAEVAAENHNPKHKYWSDKAKEIKDKQQKDKMKMAEDVIDEVSSELLDRYKTKAKKSADDLASKGQYKQSNDRTLNVMKATGKQIEKTTAGIKKALNREGYQSHSGPSHGHAYGGSGFGKRPREDDEYHVPDPVAKDHPHAVHINGKKWKTFGSEGHANNVAKKIKNATVHKEEVEHIDEISQKLAGDYYGAATKKHIDKVGVKPDMYNRIEKDMGKQRKAGVDRALDRVTGARKTNEEHEQIQEKAIHNPEHGLSDGSDVIGFADYARLLGATQPFSASGERSNDDLEKKYGELLPDVKQATSYQNPETSQYPIQPKGAVTTTAPKGTPDQVQNPPATISKNYSQKTRYRLESVEYEELNEEDFDEEISQIEDLQHIIDAYDDSELVIIDEDTGEVLEEVDTVTEDALNEVLGRMERIRRKQRFARTKSKREIRTKIALKKTSSMPVLNKRAKRLAITMIKKRMLRKDPSKASVQEKERIEKFLASRPQLVQRLSRRLVPRVRQVEKARLRGHKYSAGKQQ